MPEKGYLVLIGGAEEKNGSKHILKKIVELNNAREVVVIPSASSEPRKVADDYYYAFRDLGVYDVHNFDIRDRREADQKEYLEKIDNADLVFLTGGDQVKLVETLYNTRLLRKIKRKFQTGMTIAGTSAGAAAASDPLIYDGDDRGFVKMGVKFAAGFGLMKNLTIDTHFFARERLLRLTQFLLTGKSHRGLGLDENTAAFIAPDKTFEVVGTGMVTVVNTKRVTYNDFSEKRELDPLNVNGVNVGFLHEGAVFNLQYWKVVRQSDRE